MHTNHNPQSENDLYLHLQPIIVIAPVLSTAIQEGNSYSPPPSVCRYIDAFVHRGKPETSQRPPLKQAQSVYGLYHQTSALQANPSFRNSQSSGNIKRQRTWRCLFPKREECHITYAEPANKPCLQTECPVSSWRAYKITTSIFIFVISLRCVYLTISFQQNFARKAEQEKKSLALI